MAYFKSHAKFRFLTMEKSEGTAIVALERAEDADKLAREYYSKEKFFSRQ